MAAGSQVNELFERISHAVSLVPRLQYHNAPVKSITRPPGYGITLHGASPLETVLHHLMFMYIEIFQEVKTAELLKEVEELESALPKSEGCDESPELSALRTTNAKLQYQILHLKRVCGLPRISSV